ncbi:Phosphoesterase family protein [Planctomycetes bacterium Poly30]|uniref:Phosphoesterase family protein n=1 Tax=Saltatorellus ferox TaxID=2528018 RepID=A0A518F0Y5_9BACT|nr:Phosphoesterase family protein [Planctomycetes bacterium Poly30]
MKLAPRRLILILCATFLGPILGCQSDTPNAPRAPKTPVGRAADGSVMTPVNQLITPHGRTADLPGLRPQALAMSRDGRSIYVSGKTAELLVMDAETLDIRQRVQLPSEEQRTSAPPVSDHILDPDTRGQLSFTGLVVSPDGASIYLSNVRGSIKVFRVDASGAVTPSHTISLPPARAPKRSEEIPSGLAVTADGERLFVCGNLSNQLLEVDLASGSVLRTFAVGVAPFDVVLHDGFAYVSNWGGPRPKEGEVTGPAGRGTEVLIDPETGIASRGSVSLIDLGTGATREVETGRHTCALAISPDGEYLVCAQAADDTLTVLETGTGAFVEKIWCRAKPSDLLGATPNALAFHPEGHRLYVANGTQNAIAVLEFDPEERGESRVLGMIPVGWFPGAIAVDLERGQLCVANIKGLGEGRGREGGLGNEFNTHQYHGTVTLAPLPDREELEELSARVDANLRLPAIEAALAPPRRGRAPVALPERIGEPSLIEHVVYIIKENRTYDQILGDVDGGNGDPTLCIFGEEITPNQHALAREFVLLDNTYCAGILSADGHNWSTSAFGNDYLERSFAGWPRSYPDGMLEQDRDALAYSPAGFLWDHAIAARVSLRNYGEFCMPRVGWTDPKRSGEPDFLACFAAWKGDRDDVAFGCQPVVPSLEAYSPRRYVGWNMSVPDQYRADVVLEDLEASEAAGTYPQLTLICLPNDHTSGTSAGCPTPRACMADGDLAVGRIIEGLSHSSFWPRMAIFVIEDDPQAGWDHVSGYRTTAFVASPYARRGALVSQQYNTTSMLRTMEQILGIPPMNQFDASASPMFECFTNEPDLTPFVAQANRVPLDEMNPDPEAIADPIQRADAVASAAIDWSAMDRAPEDLLNRILWRAMRGTSEPYPKWAIDPNADDDDDD